MEVNPFALKLFSLEKYLYFQQFDVDQWYPALRPYTFESHFIDMSIDDANAMKRMYRSKLDDIIPTPTGDDLQRIEEMKVKMDQIFAGFRAKNKTAFVRLSGRSPKDAGQDGDDKLKQMIVDEVSQFEKQGISVDPNFMVQALYKAVAKYLSVSNADEAMSLLLNSQRVNDDLCYILNRFSENWKMQIIIREFVELDPSYEFRGFVCNKVLTALTQYNELCFYPHIQGREVELANRIVTFFLTVRDHIPFNTCVVDFIILGDEIKIIELNPFGEMCGGSLFQWSERNILQGGADVFNDLTPEACEYNPQPLCHPSISQFSATIPFENGWKTILRVNSKVPEKLNEEYLQVMYDDILPYKAKPKTNFSDDNTINSSILSKCNIL
eukprot:Phypoly_transcript_11725.p1 GENE.Phypoly_transcript_11725~~Phypoly_transcript_11725.p1  ORF type:complete len:383 (+),score=41.64 Phypoly_transcript_11725:21-1169(+)